MGDAGKHIVNLVLHTLSIILLSFIGSYLIQANNASDLDLSAIEQYKDDWNALSFTKIDIDHDVRTTDFCKSEYGSVFSSTWPGTVECCDCTGVYSVEYYR